MAQSVNNDNSDIDNQLNIAEQNAPIYIGKRTRWSTRFERLKAEFSENRRHEEAMEDLKYYLTKLDGVDMPTKLKDGGFDEREIFKAMRRKQKYWQKLEKTRFFESSQWINSQLFAKIIMDFEEHVERPLIKNGAGKDAILSALVQHVIKPVLTLINEEGENDVVLNYTAEDVYGMVYFLTGKCHINWKDYDNL